MPSNDIRTVISVLKMRGSAHSHALRLYESTAKGIVIGEPLTDYHGVTSGIPNRSPADTVAS